MSSPASFLHQTLGLDSAASGRQNNFDALRLLFALMVVVGHSYPLAPPGTNPPLTWLLHSTSIAHTGLLGFFAISGFLVTESATRRSTVSYAAGRILRIFPGLIVSLLVTILVLTFYSTLPAR